MASAIRWYVYRPDTPVWVAGGITHSGTRARSNVETELAKAATENPGAWGQLCRVERAVAAGADGWPSFGRPYRCEVRPDGSLAWSDLMT